MQANFDQAFASIAAHTQWSPAWLREQRSLAFARFKHLGLPTRQNEDWKYTSTRALAQEEFTWSPRASDMGSKDLKSFFVGEATVLVFLNGIYHPALSRVQDGEQGLDLRPMQDSLDDLEASFELQNSESSLEALNRAFFSSGALIRVAKNVVLKKPIQLLFVTDATGEHQVIAPRNHILLEDGADATIFESHFHYLESNLTNVVTEISVGANARCRYVTEKILSSDSTHIALNRIRVGRDAQVETFTLALGGKLSRTHMIFELNAPGASAKLDGLYVGRHSSHLDNVTEVLHQSAHTTSSQVYKGIMSDASRAVFNGKITIQPQAQQVNAQQLNKNLLLSKEAEVDSRPQLQIDADDVRCSHGATIGQLDEQELFYLQSRGINRADAQHMLAKAFVSDLLGRQPQHRDRLSKVLREFGGLDA